MQVSIFDVAMAREAAKSLLDELAMDALVFVVEPSNEHWELKLECNTGEGWQALTLEVDERLLLSSLEDPAARNLLLANWRKRLAACNKIPPDQ